MVKAIAIVAHPDDESIWCSGTIMLHKDWEWTIISLCRKDDMDRAPKFKKVCKKLGAKCAISDLEDDYPEKKLQSLDEVKQRIKKMMKQTKAGNKFDVLFTHGRNGEYGHNRHKEVHRTVKKMLKQRELHADKVFFFNYKKARRGFYCIANRDNAHAVTRLSAQIARAKHLLITSSYQFSKGSFEERSASSIESFRVNKHAIDGTLSVPGRAGRNKHSGRDALSGITKK